MPFVATIRLARGVGGRGVRAEGELSTSRGFPLPRLESSPLLAAARPLLAHCGVQLVMWTDRTQLFACERADPSSPKTVEGYSVCHGDAWHSPKLSIYPISSAVQPHIWKKPSIPGGQLGSRGSVAGRHLFCFLSPDLHHASYAAPISILSAPRPNTLRPFGCHMTSAQNCLRGLSNNVGGR